MNSQRTHCSRLTIEQFLADQLTEEEQRTFENHLEYCPACQHELDDLAAEGIWWEETRGFLASASPSALEESRSGPEDQENGPALFGLQNYFAPTDDPHMLGRLGGYEIAGVIGCGGMGIVLKGFDGPLNRYVAIKVLAPHLALSGAARQRFAREAKAAATVVHDNVMAIHAVAEANGLPYFVMPYVPGPSLEKRLRQNGALAVVEILRIGMQIASGLAAAHAQGLVHRDIKPANILLEEGTERVRITDFGLARAVDDASLTRTGVIAGTPQYMSPEQAAGEAVDHRSDLFSLGSVLYALCTARAPFRADTTLAVLRRVEEDRTRPIREINPDIPDWLAAIIQRLHAKRPDDRFQSAAEVAALLEGFLAHMQQPATAAAPLLPRAVDESCPDLAEPAMEAEVVHGFTHRLWAPALIVLAVSVIAAVSLFAMSFSGFNAQPKEADDLRPPVVIVDGFFNEERKDDKTWRWLADRLPKGAPLPLEGTVNLLNTNKDMTLTIAGGVPMYALKAAPTMKVVFNGETLDEFVPSAQDLKKVYQVSAAKQRKGEEYSELRITTNQVFIPAEYYKNSTDEFRRGFRLTALTWKEKGSEVPETVVFGDGFLAPERSKGGQLWRWLGDDLPKGEGPVPLVGSVSLRNTKKDMFLKIVGEVPVNAMPEAPTMKIIFNGEPLEEFVPVKRNLEKIYKVPAAKQSKEEYSVLRFTTSSFFVPKEYDKKSTDTRRMGFRLLQLTWSEKEGDAGVAGFPAHVPPASKGLPALPPDDTPPPQTGSRPWLAAALLIGMGVAIALLLAMAAGIYVFKRRTTVKVAKEPSGVAAAVISFKCSECGKNLKARVAGNKVKCPYCGKAVLAPAPDDSSGPVR